MCGIIGIASNKSVSVNIISALKKLEYRGYDSAGLATIANGEINSANNYLGYKYKISGKVVEGDRRGRELGFPTANINLLNPEQLIPLNGVYSVNLIFDRRKYKGICNIGYRPTLNNSKKITIETHIVNILDIKLYNEIVEIEFVDYLRKEIKFNNVEKLITQIKKDIKKITLMEK